MKLSQKTLAILNNFSLINPSIVIKPGSVLRSIHPQKTIMASASIDETFPIECAIYDLKQFLGVLGLFKEPELDFKDKYVQISSGKNSVKFFYASADLVVAPPDKQIKLPSRDVELDLSEDQFNTLFKALGSLGLEEVVVEGTEGQAIKVVAVDTKSDTSNRFDIETDVNADANFRVIFKSANLKLFPGNYNVQISNKKISQFTNEGAGVTYFVAVEASSQF
jgi:hypothetical protein